MKTLSNKGERASDAVRDLVFFVLSHTQYQTHQAIAHYLSHVTGRSVTRQAVANWKSGDSGISLDYVQALSCLASEHGYDAFADLFSAPGKRTALVPDDRTNGIIEDDALEAHDAAALARKAYTASDTHATREKAWEVIRAGYRMLHEADRADLLPLRRVAEPSAQYTYR